MFHNNPERKLDITNDKTKYNTQYQIWLTSQQSELLDSTVRNTLVFLGRCHSSLPSHKFNISYNEPLVTKSALMYFAQRPCYFRFS